MSSSAFGEHSCLITVCQTCPPKLTNQATGLETSVNSGVGQIRALPSFWRKLRGGLRRGIAVIDLVPSGAGIDMAVNRLWQSQLFVLLSLQLGCTCRDHRIHPPAEYSERSL